MGKDVQLVNYLPKTELLLGESVGSLLGQYQSVVIKPSEGLKGYGAVKVTKLEDNLFEIHSGKSRVKCDQIGLLEFLDKDKYRRKVYIVQERIPLARINGRPFDIRVIVEREIGGQRWSVTGRLAKVAEKGYFITNVASDILPLYEAFSQSNIRDKKEKSLIDKIDNIAIRAAHQLTEYYTDSHIIGLDIGITKSGKIYIIEANLKPSRAMFKRLVE